MRIRVDDIAIITIIGVLLAVSGCVTVNVNMPENSVMAVPEVSGNVTGHSSFSDISALNSTMYASNASSSAGNGSSAWKVSPIARGTADPNSKSDVNRRFQDVVFGNEAQYLNRWENRYVKLGIAGEYTQDDLATLRKFVIRFNNVSDTTHLTMPYENENQELMIRLVPASYFAIIDEDMADKVVRNTNTGEVYFADVTNGYSWVEKDTIYVNSRFVGEERKYLILRGLLYDMGFEGYSDDPTSIFYFNPRTTELSEMDWAVIDLMYSKKFTYGESLSSVRMKLN